MNYVMSIFIIVLIVSLLLNPYLNLDKHPIIRFTTIGLIILLLIGALTFFYSDFKMGKKEYGWQVNYMEYKNLHKYSTGTSQKIAIIDSGISNFQENNKNTTSISLMGDLKDNNGHGTMMYSIIKGYNKDVLGISPDSEILSIKVMDIETKITSDLIIQAIEKAIHLESTIINLSIGSHKFNKELSDIIDFSIQKGITVVSSSGDYAEADMMFPANKENVISVGSISANKKVSDFTNAYEDTTINAPGDEIKSVLSNKKIAVNSGTSQSTAIISGYIALLKDHAHQKNINLTNDEIKILLTNINKGQITYSEGITSIKKE